jgi:hypothetical protein
MRFFLSGVLLFRSGRSDSLDHGNQLGWNRLRRTFSLEPDGSVENGCDLKGLAILRRRFPPLNVNLSERISVVFLGQWAENDPIVAIVAHVPSKPERFV